MPLVYVWAGAFGLIGMAVAATWMLHREENTTRRE